MLWIALGIGVLLVLIGCPILLKYWFQRKSYVRVNAMCITCEKSCGKTTKKYTPVFEYTYNGRAYTEESACTTGALEEGKEYSCCVDPENPSTIMPYFAKHEPLLMALACIVALAAGVALVLFKEGIIKL